MENDRKALDCKCEGEYNAGYKRREINRGEGIIP